jgi:beta-galactosidase GanA
MIRVITLTPSNPDVFGRYNRGDHVVILYDATNGSFVPKIPDARQTEDVLFTVKKKDSTDNTITLDTFNNQKIDNFV